MPILWMMEWPGITQDEYDQIRQAVNWEGDVPDGLYHHVAAFDGKSLIVAEVWESPDHVQPFIDDRLLPVVNRLGIKTMPKVDLYETYAVFAPGSPRA